MGGGQFKQAIKQIIEAEGQPIRQLEAHKAKEQTRLKLFQDFKTKFQGMDKASANIKSISATVQLKRASRLIKQKHNPALIKFKSTI
jgi:flagellar capping protein FliD